MTSTKRLSYICYGITFIVFLTILLWGVSGSITGDEMGYSVLNFYFIMPIISFTMAFIMGIKNAFMKGFFPIIFGAFGLFIPSIVFGPIDVISLFFSFIPAVIGLGIGMLVRKLRSRS